MSAFTANTEAAQETTESDIEAQLNQVLVDCNDCLNRSDFSAALKLLDHAIDLSPGNPEILSHRGRLLLFLKKFDRARADFAEAAQIDARSAPTLSGLARCHFEKGDHAKAGICARRALDLDPANREAGEILSTSEKLFGTKSVEARKDIQQFFARAHEHFAEVEPPPLSELHLKNSRILSSREKILELMPQGGICAEIGTQTGDFARRILAILKPAKLHIFDIDFTPFDHASFQASLSEGMVELHHGDSSSSLATLPDRSFDFIYIDGDHSYEGVSKDLAEASRKIKEGGWIVCNDYTIYSPVEQIKYGVYRAVNEFCWQQGFEIVYLGLHYWSYHDVALRRMKPEAIAQAGQPSFPSVPAATGTADKGATSKLFTPFKSRFNPGQSRAQKTTNNSATHDESNLPTTKFENLTQTEPSPATIDLDSGLTLEIGTHSYIHDHKIRNPSGALTGITIGKFCSIATGLTVIGYDHHSEWAAMYPFLDDGHRVNWPGTNGIPYPQAPEFGSNKSRGDIEIGNDVWIGSDVKLFKGITIGNGAVIGACSMVNRSVEPYTIVAGIPARPLRKRFSDAEINLLQKIKWWNLPASLINRHLPLLCSSRIAELEQALEADQDFQNFKQGGSVAEDVVKIQHQGLRPNPAAPQLDVIQTIGPGDEMFTGDKAHYFGVGKSALHGIENALLAAHKPKTDIRRILDLPCGHGRVMRYFKAAFPGAQITACDLNRGAVDFCAQTFGAQPVYSQVNTSQIPLHGKFDLIWSGSLLTHLRAGQCAEFVRLFNSLVNPGGLIVFTLHGRWVERSLATNRYTYGLKSHDVAALLAEYYQSGFGYADYPGTPGYGISVSSPAYVLAQLISLPDLKLISYHEKGWDNHQDIVCLQKQSPDEPLG
jgi:acetyltransferase-like isoleucine patch superfamily enzyme/SAM-dependent methyltransferase